VGMTFAKALKAFLRQDPDICMIGEIRGLETGDIAVEAAMTGHLVLSTLHTNDAPATVTRLIDMGVPSFNVAASLVLCSAQRLLRRICPNCKQPLKQLPANKLIEAGFDRAQVGTIHLYEGRGCPNCKGSGYKGRLGAFEIMELTGFLAEAIASKVPEGQLRKIALKEGMSTLRQDGLLKASQGLTTLEQVLHTTVLPKESLPHYLLNPDEMIFEHGDVIIKEGNNDTNFYKLIQGSLSVLKGQSQIAEISQQNSYFGEMSALMGGFRTATIKSEGKSVVKVFPGDKLMEVIESYPDIAKAILTSMVDRLASSNSRLSEFIRDKAELERTYISQLSATVGMATTTKGGAIAGAAASFESPSPAASPIAGAGTTRSAALSKVLAASAKTAAPGNGGAAPPAASSPLPAEIKTAPGNGGSASFTASPSLPAEIQELTPGPEESHPSYLPPDVTRILVPKNLTAADATALRITPSEAPKAREMKSV